MENNELEYDSTISEADLDAAEKLIDIVKMFSDKNPIRKVPINYNKFHATIQELKSSYDPANPQTKEKFLKFLRKLKQIIRDEVHPEIYFISAGHGGIIIEDFGFCEFDCPPIAMQKLLERMHSVIETQMHYNLELAMSCLEYLEEKFPDAMESFKELFSQGNFEVINPSYGQPYNLIIGAESNIKQFEFGLKVAKKLGIPVNMFYASECSVHPQIPQILAGFHITAGSLRCRLLGTNPTAISGNIQWVGLDNTSIQALCDQPGVFNGEIWHGTFFREIPDFLFQAVARPFVKRLIFSSLEDFIMPLLYQDSIWRTQKYCDILGKFMLCSEFLHLTDVDGEFKFTRDQFSLGDYIFLPNELFLNNKRTETAIISAEIINWALSYWNKSSNDEMLDAWWKRFLVTQAHDNYAVPFTRTGEYSANQLSAEEYAKMNFPTETIPISELSIKVQKQIQQECQNFITESFNWIGNQFSTKSVSDLNDVKFLIFNPSNYLRRDVVIIRCELGFQDHGYLQDISGNVYPFEYNEYNLKFIAKVPPIGYSIFQILPDSEADPNTTDQWRPYYNISLNSDSTALEFGKADNKFFNITFPLGSNCELSCVNHSHDRIQDILDYVGTGDLGEIHLKIIQNRDVPRACFQLDSNGVKQICLTPLIKIEKVKINYPFGIEETKRSSTQTLDMLWLLGETQGILYSQQNSQSFLIDRSNFVIRNLIPTSGHYEFAIFITEGENNSDAMAELIQSLTPLQGIYIYAPIDLQYLSLITLDSSPVISNLWRRSDHSYLRIFNPQENPINFCLHGEGIPSTLNLIDFTGEVLETVSADNLLIGPWKIGTYQW